MLPHCGILRQEAIDVRQAVQFLDIHFSPETKIQRESPVLKCLRVFCRYSLTSVCGRSWEGRGLAWTDAENLATTGIQSPEPPAHS